MSEINKAEVLEYAYNKTKSWHEVVKAGDEWDMYVDYYNSLQDQKAWFENNYEFLIKNDQTELRYRQEDIANIHKYMVDFVNNSSYLSHFIGGDSGIRNHT